MLSKPLFGVTGQCELKGLQITKYDLTITCNIPNELNTHYYIEIGEIPGLSFLLKKSYLQRAQ